MLCQNCKKREANVMYSENINGRRKELHLCEQCSKKLGIDNIDFDIPIDFSNIFGEFIQELTEPEFVPMIKEIKKLQCENCGYTFDDIVRTKKMGCENCYDVFEDRMDSIIRTIQGANRHIGRSGKKLSINTKESINKENKNNKKQNKNDETINKEDKKINELEKLNEELKKAIKEERYEDAAKLRDAINEKKKNNK